MATETEPREYSTGGILPGHATFEATGSYASRISDAKQGHFRDGPNGLRVSSLGIGTGGVHGSTGSSSYENALQVIKYALLNGVNIIDTASNYGLQQAERMIGNGLSVLTGDGHIAREEVVICSKAGYMSGPGDASPRRLLEEGLCSADEITMGGHCLAPAYIEDQIEQSRRNLAVDTIDIYLLHNVEEQILEFSRKEAYGRIAGALLILEEARVRGSIGCYGFATAEGFRKPGCAFHPVNDLMRLARDAIGPSHHFKVLQLPINLLMTEALFDRNQELHGRRMSILEAAHELDLSVIASASIGSGRTLPIPPALRFACPPSWSDSQIALQFVRSQMQICTALVGMTGWAHAKENIAVRSVPPIDFDAPAAYHY